MYPAPGLGPVWAASGTKKTQVSPPVPGIDPVAVDVHEDPTCRVQLFPPTNVTVMAEMAAKPVPLTVTAAP